MKHNLEVVNAVIVYTGSSSIWYSSIPGIKTDGGNGGPRTVITAGTTKGQAIIMAVMRHTTHQTTDSETTNGIGRRANECSVMTPTQ